MDWAASAIKPGRQSLNRTSMDRDVPRVANDQTEACHDARPRCVCVGGGGFSLAELPQAGFLPRSGGKYMNRVDGGRSSARLRSL